MRYHLGVSFGVPAGLYANGHRAGTLVLHVRDCVDALPCDLWLYLGERITTKRALRAKRAGILAMLNREQGTAYTRLLID